MEKLNYDDLNKPCIQLANKYDKFTQMPYPFSIIFIYLNASKVVIFIHKSDVPLHG